MIIYHGKKFGNFVFPGEWYVYLELCYKILPNAQLLLQRNTKVDDICCFCLQDLQTDAHLFLQCPFACAFWFGSRLSIRPDRIQPQDLKEWLKSCLNVSIRTPALHVELTCEVISILYSVGLARNQIRFEETKPDAPRTQKGLSSSKCRYCYPFWKSSFKP